MISDSKKVIVNMVFKNEDVYDFAGVGPDTQSEIEPCDEYDESEYADERPANRQAGAGTTIVTEGYLYRKDDRIVLRYAEADSTDLANELTVISYKDGEPGILTMERNGVCRTVMVFEEGKRYLSLYSINTMTMDLTVRTYELENTLTLDGGFVRLGYTLENGGVTISSVKMTLDIKPV